ncbi:MAG: Ig-like domain-containing protein [Bacilli bacterium]|nr:Ig-like domain-containing protein [Bacilli bacterium]
MVDWLYCNKKKNSILFVAFFLFIFLIINLNMVNASSVSVKLNKDSLKMNIDDKAKLSVLITPVNIKNKEVVWTSNNKSVATVDNKGNVRAVGTGAADIIVYLKNNSSIRDKCHVVVNNNVELVREIKFKKNSVTIEEGEAGWLKVTFTPNNVDENDLVWSSSNDKVLKVTRSGRIRALAVGKAIITLSSKENENIKDSCEVTVKEKKVVIDKIKLKVKSKALYYGDTYNLNVKIIPANAVDKELIYVSNNPSLVEVNDKGKVKVLLNRNGRVVVKVYSKNNKDISDKIVISTKIKLKKLDVVSPDRELISISPKDDKSNRDVNVARGMCVANYNDYKLIYVSMTDVKASKGNIRIYKNNNKDDKLELVNVINKKNNYFGYAKNMMCISNEKKVYISTYNKRGIKSFNISDNNLLEKDDIVYYKGNKKKYSGGAMAYDNKLDKYYYADRSSYYIGDDKMKLVHKYLKGDGEYYRNKNSGISISSYANDIAAYDGKIFVIRYNNKVSEKNATIKKPRNAIDVYNSNNGEYIGTNIIKFGNDNYEVRAIDYYKDDYFIIYCFNKRKYKSYIKRIKLKY